MYLKGRVYRGRDLPSADSLPTWLHWLELAQSKTRSQDTFWIQALRSSSVAFQMHSQEAGSEAEHAGNHPMGCQHHRWPAPCSLISLSRLNSTYPDSWIPRTLYLPALWLSCPHFYTSSGLTALPFWASLMPLSTGSLCPPPPCVQEEND